MTIAIGMLYNKGALMSADSLVTTETLGHYQTKILGYRIKGADVIFSLAGNVTLAESAIQQCRSPILKHSAKKHSAQIIADSLRPILAAEYQQNVINAGWPALNEYYLILAIRADGAPAEIHHTYQKALKKSRPGVEHIGVGSDISKFLLSWVREPFKLSDERAADVLAYIVGMLKYAMPGAVGGNNLILRLPNDGGEIMFYRREDLRLIEQYTPAFEIDARNLFWRFLDETLDKDGFDKAMDGFSKSVGFWRQQWKQKRESIIWSAAPDEANDAIIDLR
jgi:hypothetical protein